MTQVLDPPRGRQQDDFRQMTTSDKPVTLTKRQREIFEFLKDKIVNRGYGPTVREIGEQFQIRSPNGVMCHLKALEKKGLIRRESNMSRAICLAESSARKMALPLVGTAVSGSPIQSAVSSDEQVDFESLFSGNNKACIQVRGTGFQSLGIIDGDHIIIDKTADVDSDALLAALDDRHSVTLCRAAENGQALKPAIPGAYPAPTRQMLGVVVGVMRQYASTVNGSSVE